MDVESAREVYQAATSGEREALAALIRFVGGELVDEDTQLAHTREFWRATGKLPWDPVVMVMIREAMDSHHDEREILDARRRGSREAGDDWGTCIEGVWTESEDRPPPAPLPPNPPQSSVAAFLEVLRGEPYRLGYREVVFILGGLGFEGYRFDPTSERLLQSAIGRLRTLSSRHRSP